MLLLLFSYQTRDIASVHIVSANVCNYSASEYNYYCSYCSSCTLQCVGWMDVWLVTQVFPSNHYNIIMLTEINITHACLKKQDLYGGCMPHIQLWCDCWLSYVAGWAAGGEKATGGAEEEGAAQGGSPQVSQGSGSLGSHHCHCAVLFCFCVPCCVLSCSAMDLSHKCSIKWHNL